MVSCHRVTLTEIVGMHEIAMCWRGANGPKLSKE